MKPTSEQLIKDIQSVMDEHIEVSINYKILLLTITALLEDLQK